MKTKNKNCSLPRQLDGETESISEPAVNPAPRMGWRRHLAKAWSCTAVAAVALVAMTNSLEAANPPAVTLVYTANGPIAGGVTVGPDGVIYFTTLKNGGNNATVTALYPGGAVKWTFPSPLVGGQTYDMWPLPILEPDDNTLLIGSDAGVFYGLDANTGLPNWSYSVNAPSGTDKKIRSTAAFNLGVSQGSVYFHCNDGYLYALKARNGIYRWRVATGNNLGNPASQGGPPPYSPDHMQTWSSSPVIGTDGTVYIGSADGKVRAFTSSGANKWPGSVNLGAPIEATMAIGADGWLYVATRENASGTGGRVFAVNPAKAAVDPTQAIEWFVTVNSGPPGIIASPVIDQGGFVYATHYHDALVKLHPKTGVDPITQQFLESWGLAAKFCQTPSLTQDGLLIVGTSTTPDHQNQDKRAIRAFHTAKPYDPNNPTWWSVGSVANQDVGDFLGSPAIICSSAGTTYIADMVPETGAGRLYKFESGSTLMAGDWPTFQAGNRRIGKVKSYSYAIMELPPFHDGEDGVLLGNLDPFGRAVGAAHGVSDCGIEADKYWPTLWRSAMPSTPGDCNLALGDWMARAINGFGDVAGYFQTSPTAWANGAYDSAAAYVVLPTPNFTGGFGMGINSSSTIVGYAYLGSTLNVFRWNKSGNAWFEQPIGAPPLSDQAYGYAISDQARIAGKARFGSPTSSWHAYVTPAPATEVSGDLGTLGGLESEAWAVNDETGTVGWAQNASAKRRAFYIQIGGASLQAVNELPRLAGTTGTTYNSEAYSVNRLGQVVGKIQNDTGAYRAFWWKSPGPGTVLTDLTTMVLEGGQTPQSLGWTLTAAVAINDAGIITGYGTQNGHSKAWILYPQCQE